MTPHELFTAAVARHQEGRHTDSEALCRQVLALEPKHPNALYLLGLLALREERAADASDFLARAAELVPSNPAFLTNLGEAYRRLGRLDDALTALSQAVKLKPDLGEAIFNLGLTWRARGEIEPALACLERASQLRPNVFLIRHELGTTLATYGFLQRAIGHFREALRLSPESVEARVDLATALRMAGAAGLDEAVRLLRSAIDKKPGFALAHNNLGVALIELRCFDEAVAAFERTLELEPNFADAWLNLGNAKKELGLVPDALRAYRRALELKPTSHDAHHNLTYTLSFDPDADDTAILEQGRAWDALVREELARTPSAVPTTKAAVERDPNRRLKVGYVSADFREHVQALFMLPLLEHHSRTEVEVFCYAHLLATDATTERHRKVADHFRPITHLSDEQAAALIRDDGIDILVDLTMHMANTRLRLFAHRPAPVQVSWLAYPGTTGFSAIDYRLTDPDLDPPISGESLLTVSALPNYAEKSLRLPETFWCFDQLGKDLEIGPLPSSANGYVTFCCLNNFCKVNPGVLDLWARVLTAVEGSRLLLLAPRGSARDRVLATFNARGVASERIVFTDFQPPADYLREYRRADICLDTFPYNGHTTSLDAWWMGVPVVTLVGKKVVGRAGLSQATNLGLSDLVATSPDQYVAIARKLASSSERLALLRASLRERISASPLMDVARFARSLEAAYRTLFRNFCEGEDQ